MRFIPALHEGTPQWFVAATSVTVFGCATLLSIVQKSFAGPAGGVPKMLLVSPPAFGKFSPFMDLSFMAAKRPAVDWGRPTPRLPRRVARVSWTRPECSLQGRSMVCIPTPAASASSAKRSPR
jgi:hypothetical protein